jgi:1-acyl-sn-glycerol-3-phosphate acyltransferase
MKRGTSQSALTIVLMNMTVYTALVAMTILGLLMFAPTFKAVKLATNLGTGRIVRLFIWLYGRGWLALVAPFVRVKCEGFEEYVKRSPRILVLNHLSFFDVYFMGALPFSDVTFAIRSWPFKMMWYRPFMDLAEYLDVERMEWEQSFAKCSKIFFEGGTVLFFPEAHRSKDGRLGRFHSGPFRLAVETGINVVPLCITGTDRLLPPGGWLLQPTRVVIRALRPIDPRVFSGELAHLELRKFVKGMMAENITQMRGETRP